VTASDAKAMRESLIVTGQEVEDAPPGIVRPAKKGSADSIGHCNTF
jgi:hypothetical protein